VTYIPLSAIYLLPPAADTPFPCHIFQFPRHILIGLKFLQSIYSIDTNVIGAYEFTSGYFILVTAIILIFVQIPRHNNVPRNLEIMSMSFRKETSETPSSSVTTRNMSKSDGQRPSNCEMNAHQEKTHPEIRSLHPVSFHPPITTRVAHVTHPAICLEFMHLHQLVLNYGEFKTRSEMRWTRWTVARWVDMKR